MEEILDVNEVLGNKYEEAFHATQGQRFGNYLIDAIAQYILVYLLSFIIVIVFELTNFYFETEASAKLFDFFFGYLFTVFYYTICEYYLKGKTIGKYVTKTKAITADNQIMDFSTVFKRSLCRIIPFDALSFLGKLGKGWHDSFSNTKVIQES